jgi:hypothetical protein
MVGVVVGRDGYVVGLAEVVGDGFGYEVGMAAGLVEADGGGFGYVVEMVVELHSLAGIGYPGCITSLRASLAPC